MLSTALPYEVEAGERGGGHNLWNDQLSFSGGIQDFGEESQEPKSIACGTHGVCLGLLSSTVHGCRRKEEKTLT